MAFDSELLDIAQAAALLRVSEASLRRWTNAGRLPSAGAASGASDGPI
jgi:predicted site-specific integrase-resolvase